jgi:predicted nucleotide-binding protein (sugar kinase/HSP70/actin superfamily)
MTELKYFKKNRTSDNYISSAVLQIKIDEITNLGAVKIRLRRLIGALEEKEARK